MMSTVLVTGASGFIGQVLQLRLTEHGHQVRALARPEQDLLSPDSLDQLCAGVDTIYHLAACAHVNQAGRDALFTTNVIGTDNLLQAAIHAGVPRFVFVSSILADPHYDVPRTAYGESKYQAEQLLTEAHRAGRIRVSIVRPVNVYGPGMKGNLMTLLKLINRGLMPPLPRFEHEFSLIGVSDLCEAIMLTGRKLAQDDGTATATATGTGMGPAVLPVTDGQRYTIKAVEQAMRQALGKPQPAWASPRWVFYLAALGLEIAGKVLRLNNSPGLRSYRALARNYRVDDSTSRMQLGYNPRATLYQALPAIVHTGIYKRPQQKDS
tara:strand:- start:44183 stop:45151 length:969 start_codon:yes stop_codon:yes gene_type:complete